MFFTPGGCWEERGAAIPLRGTPASEDPHPDNAAILASAVPSASEHRPACCGAASTSETVDDGMEARSVIAAQVTGDCARGFDSHGIGVVWIVRFPDERHGEQAPTDAEGIAPVRDCLKSVLIVLLTGNIDLSPDVDGRQLQPGRGAGLCEVAVSRIRARFRRGQWLFLFLLVRDAVRWLALCIFVIF